MCVCVCVCVRVCVKINEKVEKPSHGKRIQKWYFIFISIFENKAEI